MGGDGDREVVEVQIGRPLRAESEVVARCHLGLPVVIRVPPNLDDGTPFPTLYWLTCPLAVTRIGRLEAAGGVKRMEARAVADPAFGAGLDRAHRQYAAERDAMVTDSDAPRPSGGVGGTAQGVKCLHAHYAHHAAGGDNPVGSLVGEWIEPLDCEVPCVLGGAMNPEWVNRP
ncbi:MAG TPA: DUF501 domain-containing protein [Acidimicrobiia bacterium]|nr:DUF501 domain-containing protein [Acidimicrobiia bacterium]